jgi:hypothetical protein
MSSACSLLIFSSALETLPASSSILAVSSASLACEEAISASRAETLASESASLDLSSSVSLALLAEEAVRAPVRELVMVEMRLLTPDVAVDGLEAAVELVRVAVVADLGVVVVVLGLELRGFGGVVVLALSGFLAEEAELAVVGLAALVLLPGRTDVRRAVELLNAFFSSTLLVLR